MLGEVVSTIELLLEQNSINPSCFKILGGHLIYDCKLIGSKNL
jgi:hypothetical protein